MTTEGKITISNEIAIERSLDEAYLIDCLYLQLDRCATDRENIQDGKVWTSMSIKDWEQRIKCLTPRKFRRLFKVLADDGIIEVCNKNKNKFDQTLWYCFTDEGLEYIGCAGYDVENIRSCGESKHKVDNGLKDNIKDNKDKTQKLSKEDNIKEEIERFRQELYSDNKYIEKYGKWHVDSFFDHYSQPAEQNGGKKLRHIIRFMQRGWDVGKRLAKWIPPKYVNAPSTSVNDSSMAPQSPQRKVNVSENDIEVFNSLKKETIPRVYQGAPHLVEVSDTNVVIQMPSKTMLEIFSKENFGKIFILSVRRAFGDKNLSICYNNEYDITQTG